MHSCDTASPDRSHVLHGANFDAYTITDSMAAYDALTLMAEIASGATNQPRVIPALHSLTPAGAALEHMADWIQQEREALVGSMKRRHFDDADAERQRAGLILRYHADSDEPLDDFVALAVALSAAAKARHTHAAGGPACFYCDGPLGSDMHRGSIYPRTLTRALHSVLPAAWHQLNRVLVCPACNAAKGHLHPREWLAVMPEAGRDRLRRRLDDLAAYHEPVASAGHALAA